MSPSFKQFAEPHNCNYLFKEISILAMNRNHKISTFHTNFFSDFHRARWLDGTDVIDNEEKDTFILRLE